MSADRPADDVSGTSAGKTGATPATGRVAPSNWNLPNALTALRILLVPLLGWLLLADDGNDTELRIWAFVVFLAAILTDKIDGEVARRRNLVTEFGKLMDPIADKALTGMAFVGLSIIGELWWWVTILVLAREWGITLMRFWVIRYGVMPASRGGKIKTTLQAVALCGFILPLLQLDGALGDIGHVLWWVAVAIMAAAVAVTILTGLDYVREATKLRRDGQAAADATTRPAPPSS
ncbi:MAG: CDP-diacylglycerol--glycerol-3-phosphate 3-phosphatidyltransferase [Actinomycetota bacterium]|nr:CDP-diacylglycerol--glycerol-3-phosphate 3-phosphatidyltransferase [Actinomycetota bacterium]